MPDFALSHNLINFLSCDLSCDVKFCYCLFLIILPGSEQRVTYKSQGPLFSLIPSATILSTNAKVKKVLSIQPSRPTNNKSEKEGNFYLPFCINMLHIHETFLGKCPTVSPEFFFTATVHISIYICTAINSMSDYVMMGSQLFNRNNYTQKLNSHEQIEIARFCVIFFVIDYVHNKNLLCGIATETKTNFFLNIKDITFWSQNFFGFKRSYCRFDFAMQSSWSMTYITLRYFEAAIVP